MANWRPQYQATGCGCTPCLTGSVVARHLAEAQIVEIITVAIGRRPQ